MACQKSNARTDSTQRLQKYLAACGVGSRRACERLIAEERVTVDGAIVSRQGVKINPRVQVVAVDGRPVAPGPKIHILFNKPRDVICTSSDPAGRKTFHAFLPALPARVFTVGRLDRASAGLLIITSDGELAQAVAHPSNMIVKTYLASIPRALTPEEERRLKAGVHSAGEVLRVAAIWPAGSKGSRHVYELKIHEGRNRHIRRMFAALKLDVAALKRIAIGPLKLGSLAAGQWRYMQESELAELRRYIARRRNG